MTQVAAALCLVNAIGFGLPCVPAIRELLAGRAVPLLFGFPAYGGGPFERIGLQSSVPLISAFLVVCVFEGLAGWLLWGGHRSGAILALALLPVGAVFWVGFALPIAPLTAIVRTALIAASWGSLR